MKQATISNKTLIIFFTVVLLYSFISCKSVDENELQGFYVPIGYKNNFDTLNLRANGIYYRKVYNINRKLVLRMEGKWILKSKKEIQFYSYYFNQDDDLVAYPGLVRDTSGGRSSIVEKHNDTIQFCVGYYQDQNCYKKIN